MLTCPSGVLHAFSSPSTGSCFSSPCSDTMNSSVVQQTAGQTTIYWIDGPAAPNTNTNNTGTYPVDSVTATQNLTTTFTSTVSNKPTPYNWYVYLVVDPGSTLDTTKSHAGNGTAP